MTYDRWFEVTVENYGEQNVTGLFSQIRIFINQTEFKSFDIATFEYSTPFNFSTSIMKKQSNFKVQF